jgi:hypothetical protein
MALAAVALAGVVLLVGCDSSGMYRVSGTVRVDGQPLAKGYIQFNDKEGRVQTAAGEIVDGQYSIKSLPGNKVVQISAARGTGRFARPAPDAEPIEAKEEYIAPEFNLKSTVEVEVTKGKNTFDFDAKSIGPRKAAN